MVRIFQKDLQLTKQIILRRISPWIMVDYGISALICNVHIFVVSNSNCILLYYRGKSYFARTKFLSGCRCREHRHVTSCCCYYNSWLIKIDLSYFNQFSFSEGCEVVQLANLPTDISVDNGRTLNELGDL